MSQVVLYQSPFDKTIRGLDQTQFTRSGVAPDAWDRAMASVSKLASSGRGTSMWVFGSAKEALAFCPDIQWNHAAPKDDGQSDPC